MQVRRRVSSYGAHLADGPAATVWRFHHDRTKVLPWRSASDPSAEAAKVRDLGAADGEGRVG